MRLLIIVLLVIPMAAMSTTASAQSHTVPEQHRNGVASGTFDVRITPQWNDEPEEGTPLGRSSIEKQYHGDLEGEAVGVMLTVVTATEGSAAYVAIERFSGRVHGREGTFVLQHRGTMDRGERQLSITVVPDSGTGELEGLTGSMTIDLSGGRHAYELEYSLPADR